LAAVGVVASAVGWTPSRPVDSIRSPTALAAVGVEASTVGWSPFSRSIAYMVAFPLWVSMRSGGLRSLGMGRGMVVV